MILTAVAPEKVTTAYPDRQRWVSIWKLGRFEFVHHVMPGTSVQKMSRDEAMAWAAEHPPVHPVVQP